VHHAIDRQTGARDRSIFVHSQPVCPENRDKALFVHVANPVGFIEQFTRREGEALQGAAANFEKLMFPEIKTSCDQPQNDSLVERHFDFATTGQLKMRFVPQIDRTKGCGPACIAMLAGQRFSRMPKKAYEQAVELMFGSGDLTVSRTQWTDLRQALGKLGIAHADRIQRRPSWEGISTVSIVKCGVTADGNWHWVVFDGVAGILYDPMHEKPVKPNGRHRKPVSHLSILG
jgi:hypothetical protein